MNETIKATFESLKKQGKLREAAEYAYALAVICKDNSDNDSAILYGQEAITLFDQCSMNTAEECAPINVNIGEISMPSSFIHQDVVRKNLQPLSL